MDMMLMILCWLSSPSSTTSCRPFARSASIARAGVSSGVRFRRASRLRSLPRAQACRRRTVRLVVFRAFAVFVVKEMMLCQNYLKLKRLRGR